MQSATYVCMYVCIYYTSAAAAAAAVNRERHTQTLVKALLYRLLFAGLVPIPQPRCSILVPSRTPFLLHHCIIIISITAGIVVVPNVVLPGGRRLDVLKEVFARDGVVIQIQGFKYSILSVYMYSFN